MTARRWLAPLVVVTTLLALPGAAAAVQIRTSLTAVEGDLMCVVCHEPLAVANSPQAYSERAYIRKLIQRGETRAQIDRDMVAQYGPSVLAKPPARGFSLLLYILPPLLVAIGLAILAFTLPRWRRRAAARASTGP
ncbi:MAG: cytochrome c-type biogenesis protein, partial [Chloroflexota bacterium]